MWKLWKNEPVAIESLNAKEIEGLKEGLRSLDGRMKDIELQWEQTFTRMRRIIGQISKTSALDAREQMAIAQPTPPPQASTKKSRDPNDMTRDEIAAIDVA